MNKPAVLVSKICEAAATINLQRKHVAFVELTGYMDRITVRVFVEGRHPQMLGRAPEYQRTEFFSIPEAYEDLETMLDEINQYVEVSE